MEGKQVLFGGKYEHYFDFHYGKNKELLFARERPKVIEELDLCGYFSIITSEEMSARTPIFSIRGGTARRNSLEQISPTFVQRVYGFLDAKASSASRL
ncbi:MAG: hypothetical protein V8T56_01605 [Parasutterella sp.]|uniref:hypothetical protein n=1 Tax=Parasutterella sp. TaxID=2049037 RepID=UPI00300E92C3